MLCRNTHSESCLLEHNMSDYPRPTLPPSPRIFVVGIPKCGTESFHALFQQMGRQSLHYEYPAGGGGKADNNRKKKQQTQKKSIGPQSSPP